MAEGNFGARDQINLQDSGGLLVIANAITAMTCNCLKQHSANDWLPLAVGRLYSNHWLKPSESLATRAQNNKRPRPFWGQAAFLLVKGQVAG